MKIRDEVRTEPDAGVSVRPLSTERGEVKPASPRVSGSLVCLSGSPLWKPFPAGLLLILRLWASLAALPALA